MLQRNPEAGNGPFCKDCRDFRKCEHQSFIFPLDSGMQCFKPNKRLEQLQNAPVPQNLHMQITHIEVDYANRSQSNKRRKRK